MTHAERIAEFLMVLAVAVPVGLAVPGVVRGAVSQDPGPATSTTTIEGSAPSASADEGWDTVSYDPDDRMAPDHVRRCRVGRGGS